MKLQRELLKIFKYYTLSRGVPSESLRPKDSENVVLFGSSSSAVELLALKVRSNSKKKSRQKKMSKKRHRHNFDFSAPKRIARLLDIVENPCYSFHGQNKKIVAVSFFLTLPICGDTPTFPTLC